jgi:hypothetical protein
MNRFGKFAFSESNSYAFEFSKPMECKSVAVKSCTMDGVDVDIGGGKVMRLDIIFNFTNFFGWENDDPNNIIVGEGVFEYSKTISQNDDTNYAFLNFIANDINKEIEAKMEGCIRKYIENKFAFFPGTVDDAVRRYKVFNFVSLEARVSGNGLTFILNCPNDFNAYTYFPTSMYRHNYLQVSIDGKVLRSPEVRQFNVMRYDTNPITQLDEAKREFTELSLRATTIILRDFSTNCSFMKGFGLTFCNVELNYDFGLFANRTFDKILICSGLSLGQTLINVKDINLSLSILDSIDIDYVFTDQLVYKPNPMYYKKLDSEVPSVFSLSLYRYNSTTGEIKKIQFATMSIELHLK